MWVFRFFSMRRGEAVVDVGLSGDMPRCSGGTLSLRHWRGRGEL